MPDRNWSLQGELEISGRRRFRPPPDEPFGMAEEEAFHCGNCNSLVNHLNHALLILGRQDRQDGWSLSDSPGHPLRAASAGVSRWYPSHSGSVALV